VVLGGGRVDMPLEFSDIFRSGMNAFFANGTDITLDDSEFLGPSESGEETMELEIEGELGQLTLAMLSNISSHGVARLQSSAARERYSIAFANLQLEKLTYLSGLFDEQVGRFDADEIAVLESSGANVMIFETGHDLEEADEIVVGILQVN
jgi:hypothetical protein